MNISIINPILKEQINEITNNKNPLIPFEIKKKEMMNFLSQYH